MAVPLYLESLPYIDDDPSPHQLSAARDLIAAEQSTFQPTSPAPPAQLSFSPLIQAELDRISASQPSSSSSSATVSSSSALDLSRYEAQDLVDASRASLQRAAVSAEYLSSRAVNLALLDHSGRNAWLLGNYHLEAELRSIEADLAAVRRDVDLVNAARAARQNSVAAELRSLQSDWSAGVGRLLETLIAVEDLRSQIRTELGKNTTTSHDAPA